MLLLSATPGLAGSRILPSSTSRPYILPADRRREARKCACLRFSSRVKPAEGWRSSVLASDLGAGGEVAQSRPPLRARSEEELLSYVRKEVEIGRLSSDIAHGLEELYRNYRNAVLQSGLAEADEIILSNMTVAFDRILIDIENPFTFPPYHKATREPFDYYMFGQNYIRPLLDFKLEVLKICYAFCCAVNFNDLKVVSPRVGYQNEPNNIFAQLAIKSYVGNISIFSEMEQHLLQGHNIILFSNHQTEADPAIIGLLLERTNPQIDESMVFVAGDRVVTDPLCKPFSMGRNLLCVYSKKHLFDDPELFDLKTRANTRSLKEMAALLKRGSQIIWIAPSGGRDRPDPETGEWFPAPFDASSLDNMRRLAEHSGAPGHLYPLALLCYDVMPPPAQVEKEIGEQRKLSYHGVGLSVAPEINFNEVSIHSENKEETKVAFSVAVHHAVTEQYNILKSAIYEHQGLNASDSKVSLSQPWV